MVRRRVAPRLKAMLVRVQLLPPAPWEAMEDEKSTPTIRGNAAQNRWFAGKPKWCEQVWECYQARGLLVARTWPPLPKCILSVEIGKLTPPLIIWEGMQAAKARDCKSLYFDLGAVWSVILRWFKSISSHQTE